MSHTPQQPLPVRAARGRILKPLAVLALTAGLAGGTLPAATAAPAAATATHQGFALGAQALDPPTPREAPVSVTVSAGETAYFATDADGTVSQKWQVSTDGGQTFTDIEGTDDTYLLVEARYADNGNQYRAAFVNEAGTSFSEAATLTVNPVEANITAGPEDVFTTAGSEVSFTAEADGDPAPTVRWQVSKDDAETWTDLAGATSTTYTTTAPRIAESGGAWYYRAVFTNAAGSVTTWSAGLYVDETAPTVLTSPADVEIEAGEQATFTATAAGDPDPDIQWEVSTDGGKFYDDIDGATQGSHSFVPTKADTGNLYRARFSNGAGEVTTSAAKLTVNGTAPAKPGAMTAKQTGPGQVTVTWTEPSDPGSSALTGYDVGYSGGEWGNGETAPATARSMVIKNLAPGTYTFSVAAVNAAGAGDRVVMRLKVNATRVPLTLGASARSLTAGEVLTLHGTGTTAAKAVLQRALPGQKYKALSSFTVAADGTFSRRLKVTGTATYRVLLGGKVSSARKVTVAHRLTLNAARKAVRSYVLSGSVSPARKGHVVAVAYQRAGGTWVSLGRTKTAANGSWTLNVRLSTAATYTFKATAAASSTNAAASVTRTVEVS